MVHLLKFPKVSNIKFISTNQMVEVDRLMIEEYNINLFQMMENAGRSLALTCSNILKSEKLDKILIIAGTGGNGGGGLTAARRLFNWGINVDILLTSEKKKYSGTIGNQLSIVQNMGINIFEILDFDFDNQYDLIIDSMIGYNLKGKLKSKIVTLIDWVNSSKSIKVSLDVPSGIDSTTGIILSTCIHADFTMTLALPKIGFTKKSAKRYIGVLLLADISVPPSLYKNAFDIDIGNIFSLSDIVIVS